MSLSAINMNPISNTPQLFETAASPRLALRRGLAQVEHLADPSCYPSILAKYPGMDSASQAIVKILCENAQDTLNLGNVYFSDPGIYGIGDALQQNANLRSLTISNPSCLDFYNNCRVTLGTVLGNALKVNRGLQTLTVDFLDSNPATQAFVSNLACSNLRSLTMRGVLDSAGGKTLSDNLSQLFPLRNFSHQNWGSFMDSATTASISNGFAKNVCIKTVNLVSYQTADQIATLFKGLGGSRVEDFKVPPQDGSPYAFSEEQKNEIIAAVQSNPCFLRYEAQSPFPPDLAAAIANITQTRTACQPDPKCDIPPSCSSPTPSPDPNSSCGSSFAVGLGVGVGIGLGAASLVALAVYLVKKCRHPVSQPLLS